MNPINTPQHINPPRFLTTPTFLIIKPTPRLNSKPYWKQFEPRNFSPKTSKTQLQWLTQAQFSTPLAMPRGKK